MLESISTGYNRLHLLIVKQCGNKYLHFFVITFLFKQATPFKQYIPYSSGKFSSIHPVQNAMRGLLDLQPHTGQEGGLSIGIV